HSAADDLVRLLNVRLRRNSEFLQDRLKCPAESVERLWRIENVDNLKVVRRTIADVMQTTLRRAGSSCFQPAKRGLILLYRHSGDGELHHDCRDYLLGVTLRVADPYDLRVADPFDDRYVRAS